MSWAVSGFIVVAARFWHTSGTQGNELTRALTDVVVQKLTPKQGQKGWRWVADAGCPGLRLRISPKGEKAWALRTMVATKRHYHTIGGYPTVSLAEARHRVHQYRSAARDDIRPEEVDARAKADKLTFSEAHTDYLVAVGNTLRSHTLRLKRDIYQHHIKPKLGDNLIRTVRGTDIAELVNSVVRKGFHVQANRVFSETMALLRWCEQKGYISGIPTVKRKDMQKVGAAKEMPRRRTLTDGEIAVFWLHLENAGTLTGDFGRLLLLTGQRLSEIREMRWEEVNLEERLWVIPGSRYKTGVDHVVPLSKAVVVLLKGRWTKDARGYVLAGRKGRPFNGHASAMKRLREGTKDRSHFTWHDLRRTFRSGLSRLGIHERTAEMAIGHIPQGIVRTYDMYDRLAERRIAFERWATFLVDTANSGSNVLTLSG